MKKTMLFSSALVALAMLASCQKEEFVETPATATGVTEFTATIESTKTSIDASDGKVTWTAGDEITVTDAESKSAVYVAASSETPTTFTLKTGQTAVGSGPYTATYGDITKQVYDVNGANCPLSAGKTTGTSTNLQFSSPYAVLKITAKSSGGETIKTVVVKYGNSSSVLDCEGQNVTLTSDGVAFYVAVQPSTEAAALSVTFYNTANKMAKKTRNGSILLDAKDLLPVTLGSFEWTDLKTFKAMYKETDGSLTFYYDTQSHSGEGITVYENGTGKSLFDDTKSNGAKWGYNENNIRSKIKSVVIDDSVEEYPFLTSTAFMFQGMTIATNISGAEYLDVSNVTNMSYMFQNFGGGKSGSPTTLNVVPDVSQWNTGNVKNMLAMFESYGNFSSSLDKVPDVSGWNTGNVTNMSFMFQKYGHESQNFNAVPDVSKWNTGKVEDMHQMFFEYGHKSTALNTVPDVSGWNTGNVTNMSGMFNGYGYTSTNISCVLDLSGWDLSKITGTNGDNVFNFNPKTFDVTIPAKTGAKSNEGDKWYYGDGTNYIAPPTDKTFTLPAN